MDGNLAGGTRVPVHGMLCHPNVPHTHPEALSHNSCRCICFHGIAEVPRCFFDAGALSSPVNSLADSIFVVKAGGDEYNYDVLRVTEYGLTLRSSPTSMPENQHWSMRF